MAKVLPNVTEQLAALLEGHEATRGLLIRARGGNITLVREEPGLPGEPSYEDPRVRLTDLGGGTFGLSVMRHTGRWERTPFTGSARTLVGVMCGVMPHIVGAWP